MGFIGDLLKTFVGGGPRASVLVQLDTKQRLPQALDSFSELQSLGIKLSGDGSFLENIYAREKVFEKNYNQIFRTYFGSSGGSELAELQGLLAWDKGNEYDPNAIAVYISGLQVGYLTSAIQDQLIDKLKRHWVISVPVRIRNGWIGADIDLPS